MIALVTGGSASGKSALAERVATDLHSRNGKAGRLCYVATMSPYGIAAQQRIARHQQLRQGKGFITLEQPRDLHELVLQPNDVVLVECLGNWLANQMYAEDWSLRPADAVARELQQGVAHVAASAAHVVFVGNQVGADGCAYAEETQAFIHLLGQAQCRIAAQADLVVECTAGFPLVVKGALPWC